MCSPQPSLSISGATIDKRRQSKRRSRLARSLANALNLARSEACQSSSDRSDKWPKILHPVGTRLNHYDAEGKTTEIMLMFELAIHRQKRINLPRRAPEQLAVLDPSPPESLDRHDFMTAQFRDQVVGKILVKQNAHWSTGYRERIRARQSPDPA